MNSEQINHAINQMKLEIAANPRREEIQGLVSGIFITFAQLDFQYADRELVLDLARRTNALSK